MHALYFNKFSPGPPQSCGPWGIPFPPVLAPPPKPPYVKVKLHLCSLLLQQREEHSKRVVSRERDRESETESVKADNSVKTEDRTVVL